MSAEILKVIQEMRERKVNHGRGTSPALEAWADRLEAALSQQADPVCRFCGKPSGDCDQSFPHPSEPAPAQDERDFSPDHTLFSEIRCSMPVNDDGEETRYIINEQQLQRIRALEFNRPAQTEQQRPTAYPHEAMDKLAADRYRVGAAGAGTLHGFAVRAGDGEQELYRGSKSDCEHVARKLAGAFLDGGFTAFERYAALIAQTAPQQAEPVEQANPLRYKDDPRTPVELSNAGCRCVRFGEGNPHWPCSIHTAPPQDEQEEDQHDNSTR